MLKLGIGNRKIQKDSDKNLIVRAKGRNEKSVKDNIQSNKNTDNTN